jgi:predicted acylesterase/phospholipase RssA
MNRVPNAGDDPQREIRLALVLNGGVSLAVWMGGVTHEIDDLRRSSWQFDGEPVPTYSAAHEVYKGILKALNTGLRVDVISGSSAGGINGAALAAAIGVRRPLRVDGKPLSALWLNVGDFAGLLRPVSDANPKSLLQGDEYMLPHMRSAFGSIIGAGPSTPMPVEERALGDACSITKALRHEREDATTVRLFVTTTAFRANVRTFQDALETPFSVLDNRLRFRIVRDRWHGRDDFTRPDLASVMGLAARATASFPIAFEPTRLTPTLPSDMLVLDHETYVMDGGVLDNEPFDAALDQIGQMPADGDVERHLVYIVPYANASVAPEQPASQPDLRHVLSSVVNLPRDAGIDRDMDRLVNLRALAQMREDATHRLLTGKPDLKPLATSLVAQQQAYRHASASDEVDRRSSAAGVRLGPNGGPETVYQTFPQLDGWEAPDSSSGGALAQVEDADSWRLGFAAAERLARRALAVLRRELKTTERRDAVVAARAVASRAQTLVRSLSIEYADALTRGAGTPTAPDPQVLYDSVYESKLRQIVDTVVCELAKAVPAPDGSPIAAETWRQRLIRVEVITQSLPSSLARGVPPFDFIRLSSDCGNALGIDRCKPDEKLAGLQLGHFGGFMKRSWRANDWIWGRLDGAWYLIRLLLMHKDRIAQLNPDTLAMIAFPDEDVAATETLGRLWDRADPPPDAEAARERFTTAFADGEEGRARCIEAIIARAQLAILTEEIPGLAAEAAADQKAGWRKNVITPKPSSTPVTPAEALTAFASGWDGADERISEESGTRAFAKLAGHAAVVGASFLAGSKAKLPGAIRLPFVWLRGAALGAYLFVQSWFRSPLAGLTVAVLLAAAAIVTVLVSSALAAITVPLALGVGVMAAALLLGHGPRPLRALWTGVAIGTAAVACVGLYHHTGHGYPGGERVSFVVAGGVGLVLGGVVEIVIPRWRLVVFLAAVLVAALAGYAWINSSGPLLDWATTAVRGHWPVGLLTIGLAIPLAFGMAAIASDTPGTPPSPP